MQSRLLSVAQLNANRCAVILATCRDLLNFCQMVYRYMAESEQNVIAVHCKGGKGQAEEVLFVIDLRMSTFLQCRRGPCVLRYLCFFPIKDALAH